MIALLEFVELQLLLVNLPPHFLILMESLWVRSLDLNFALEDQKETSLHLAKVNNEVIFGNLQVLHGLNNLAHVFLCVSLFKDASLLDKPCEGLQLLGVSHLLISLED